MVATALAVTEDLAAIESEIDLSLTELRLIAIRGVQIIASLGRPFFEIHRRKIYKQRCDSWDDYCEARFGIPGSRCRRLADAYEVGRTLSASAGIDGTKDPTMMLEYLASLGFSEFIARNLRHVPAEQQAAVLDTARHLADGAPVTGKMVDAVAGQAATPLEWSQMTADEQREAIQGAEGRLGPEWDRQRVQEWVQMVLKRNRAPLELAGELPLSDQERPIVEQQRRLVELCEKALGKKPAAPAA